MKKEYRKPYSQVFHLTTTKFVATSPVVGKSDDEFDPSNVDFTRRRMWMDDEE